MIFLESIRRPVTAYVLSLVGGIIIFLSGVVGLLWFATGGPGWGGFGGWMSGMMGGYHTFVGSPGYYNFFSVISVLGVFSGIVVIVSAVLLYLRPQDHLIWGVLILVFALVSFADMGGYFIGALLGVIGGAFALSYRPRTSAQSQIR